MNMRMKLLGAFAFTVLTIGQASATVSWEPASRFLGYSVARADVSNMINTMVIGGWFNQSGYVTAGGTHLYKVVFNSANVTFDAANRTFSSSVNVHVVADVDFVAFRHDFDRTYDITLTSASKLLTEPNGALRLQFCPSSFSLSGGGTIEAIATMYINSAISAMGCTDVASFANVLPSIPQGDIESGPDLVWEAERVKIGYTIKDIQIPKKKYGFPISILSLLLD
jgi:hypothetical protein